MKQTITLAAMLLSLTFAGCTKKGDTGPQGPAGTNGTNGKDGKDGNANVAGTNTVTLQFSDWTANGNFYYVDLTSSVITQAIVDYGSVQVFMLQGNNTWSPLPFVYGLGGAPVIEYSFTAGAVRLVFGNSDGSALQYQPSTSTFRIVAVAAAQKRAHRNTNWKNYDEVMAIVNETQAPTK